MEVTPDGRQLAITDTSGAAQVTVDADPAVQNALYINTTRFSIERTDQQTIVHGYDREVYERVIAGLPPVAAEGSTPWKITYRITGSGSPITGIPAVDPLTGHVFASGTPTRRTSGPETQVVVMPAGDSTFVLLGDLDTTVKSVIDG